MAMRIDLVYDMRGTVQLDFLTVIRLHTAVARAIVPSAHKQIFTAIFGCLIILSIQEDAITMR